MCDITNSQYKSSYSLWSIFYPLYSRISSIKALHEITSSKNHYILLQIRHRNMCEIVFNTLKESLQNHEIIDQIDFLTDPIVSDDYIEFKINTYKIKISFVPLLQLDDKRTSACKENSFMNKLCFTLFYSLISSIYQKYRHSLSTTVYRSNSYNQSIIYII